MRLRWNYLAGLGFFIRERDVCLVGERMRVDAGTREKGYIYIDGGGWSGTVSE